MTNKSALYEPVTIPPVASDSDQRDQVERLIHEFTRYLARRRGPRAAVIWRRTTDRFVKTNQYEQIRSALESDFNMEITLTRNEINEIINP